MSHNHTFAPENSPVWNEYWNKGYNDCASPDGYLIIKPVEWHEMLWNAYCDGVAQSISDARFD